VWAPAATRVDVRLEAADHTVTRPLVQMAGGMFTGWVPDLEPGALYRFVLDRTTACPDPASRFQPHGPHGPSCYVDPRAFVWTDERWRGVSRDDLVIYELHVGTFTPEGTFAGVEARLDYLAALGVNAIELMPIAEFAGSRNWGYDGVDLFAPSHHYGTPDDLRRLIDAAHRRGLAVLLDVVYNHLGPDGASLSAFSRQYFSDRHRGPWGDAINLDGPGSDRVRAFLIENALHWIHEYHVDGLRLDATHEFHDSGRPHFLAEFTADVRTRAGRPVLLIAEDERNSATVLEPPPRGYGLDATWADDWHHQMRVALAGDRDGYFAAFDGSAADIAATIRQGWFYTGQAVPPTGEPRGSNPAGLASSRFVVCLQNHDQVGNRAFGDRLHHAIDPAAYRAASALLLVMPQVPLIFMGQEWAASTPFRYFTDHEPALGRVVTAGRREEFAAFAAFADPSARSKIPDPQDRATFEASQLMWAERGAPLHAGIERLYRRLLRLRRADSAFRDPATPLQVGAPDADTVILCRGRWMMVTRLRGAGAVDIDNDWAEVFLTTEDREFGGCPDSVEIDAPGSRIHFSGPASVLLVQ
jgi:maltooligosyltrehalose trehalohydrolase